MSTATSNSYRPIAPGMGQAVAERTILRKNENGEYETWGDVADRVARGNSLLFDGPIHTSDEEYELLRKHIANGNTLMSGRHLQHGDELQPTRNMEVFTNCGRVDTQFITLEHGVTTFGKTVGTIVTVRCSDGQWRSAHVKQYGTQLLYALTFRKVGPGPSLTKTEYFTRNHRWLLKDGTVTEDIQIGDLLHVLPIEEDRDPMGVVHGLIFGDGSGHKSRNDKTRKVSQGRTYASIRVCKQDAVKDEIIQLLDTAGYSYTTPASSDGDPVYYVGKFPYAKDVPFTRDPAYIAGFIYGWWLADGSKTEANGTWTISTSNNLAAEWLLEHSVFAGLTVLSHRTIERTSNDGSYPNGKPLHIIRMRGGVQWKLESITADVEEQVYCVEEPVSKSFTLASGIVTGNCSTSSTSFMLFYLLLNGSGVGRCYDDDMVLVNWDHAPNLRCVLDSNHPDFNYSAHESVRDAKHKYGTGKDVMWFSVPDSREGWAKALELWENAAWEKIHANKMLILDFSNVRPKGSPIAGMQNRPASGPVALMDAFEKAAKLKGAGLMPWKQAMYLDHYFAECVLVGGARRAARMSTKHWSDETIFDYITIKRPIEFAGKNVVEIALIRSMNSTNLGFLWSSNNSVTVDDEFWVLVKDTKNKSPRAKHAKKVFRLVCEAAYADGTGEPGFINSHMLVQKDDGWTDLNRGDYAGSKKYQINDDTQILMSRLAKRAKKKKYHTITNPSLRAGTKVLTQDGIVGIEKLDGKVFRVKNLRGEFADASCWLSSPNAPLYKITLDGGVEYYATAEHQWPVIENHSVRKHSTSELTEGMCLPVIQPETLFDGKGGTYSEGFLVGWNLGDGWRTVRNNDGTLQLGFCVHSEDRESEIDVKLQTVLEGYGWSGSILDKDEININNKKVNEVFAFTGTFGKEMGLPQLVWSGTEQFRKGVIDALFSAEGSVNKECGIILTSAHIKLIEDVRDLLGFYGIKSRYYESESILNGKTYTRYDLKISHYHSIAHFHRVFTLSHKYKQQHILDIVEAGHRGNARLADRIRVIDVVKTSLTEPVWDINVQDDTHCFQLSACITGNCGEIALNVLGGFCVHEDTRIGHRFGYDSIKTLVGKKIEVFNGQEWSEVTPMQTGTNQPLVRVTLSDGSYLDCTPYHRFAVKKSRQSKHFVEVTAEHLKEGDILPTFRMPTDIEGNTEPEAYTYGAFLGDGSIEYRKDTDKFRYTIGLYPGKHHLPISGTRGTETQNGCIDVTVSHLEQYKLHSMKQNGLPNWVFQMDKHSTEQFLMGLFDTDGGFNKNTGGIYFDTTNEQTAYDVQLLLRRFGFSFTSVNKTADIGDMTNFGPRQKPLFRVYVPASEAGLIVGHRVASDYELDLDHCVKQPRVVSVVPLKGLYDTYCFTEPKRGMGVFGNMLTFQCVIADVVPFHCDTLDEAEECFRVVTRALMRVNLMDSVYDKEVKRTNRIGVGLTGVHEFAYKFFGYGFRDLINEEKSKDFWLTMARFNRAVHEEAISYAKELGVKVPHTLTTIKPAGTTSKLFLLTEGWHLPSMREFLRWVQFRNDDPLVEIYRNDGYPTRELVQYNGTTIIGFPTAPAITRLEMGDKLITAAEATPEEQFKWLMLGEKYWIHGTDEAGTLTKENYGNQISYTLKYKPDTIDFEHFRKMILKYQSQVRCCSVMPQADVLSYEYQPEQPITSEEFASIMNGIVTHTSEDIGREHVGCDNGACPIDFNTGKK